MFCAFLSSFDLVTVFKGGALVLRIGVRSFKRVLIKGSMRETKGLRV